jgi:large subunit ribosomal protein L25
MEEYTLKVEPRDETGKGAARRLRREGLMPAIIYRAGGSESIKMDRKDLVRFIRSTMGVQKMVNLEFPDGSSKLAIMKDFQVDPARGELLHTDFYEVSLKEKVRITVPVVLNGEPIGVKVEKGVLQQVISEVEIECLPDRIPPHIDVDITDLRAGHSIHVSDLSVSEDVRIVTNPEEVIATVTVQAVEAGEAVTEEEETAEPEVIKKGKKEEEEEG